jgi:peptide/nickel transport system substrate-binding protein
MRRTFGAFVGLLATAALVAGCGNGGTSSSSSGSGQAKSGGTVTVGLAEDPDALDPTLARTFVGRIVFANMCEKLYDLDSGLNIIPQLAAALPAVSNGGKTVTIKLRTGVKFNDGTPFNAKAVKESLERHIKLEGSSRASELTPLKSVDAVGSDKVVLHLSGPYAPLNAQLADRSGMIMSPKQLAKLGDKFGNDPVCVGPFKFSDRVPQNSITLVKDPNYYDADKVHLDKIVYRIITDSAIRAANLKSGDVQVADSVSTNDVSSIQSDSNLQLLESPSLGYQGITFNVGNVDGVGKPPASINAPYAQDPRIRQAFEDAIDRQTLVKTVFNGQFDTACGPISPESQFSSPAVQKCRSYDPAKAKQLLQAAGVPVPYKLSMLVTNTPDTLKLAQALQAMVKQGGFDLKLQPLEFTTLLDQQDQGKFQVLQLGWSGRVDPDANITNFVGTQGSQNVGGYSSPKVDQLLAQARQTQDITARAKVYGQVQAQIQKDDPIIYLYRQRNLTGVTKKVSGVQVYPDGIIRVAFAGYTK